MKISQIKNQNHLKNTKKTFIKTISFGYSMLFALFSLIIFGYFLLFNEKALVSWTDGVQQHLPSLIYCGEWLRTIFKNIFIEHTFEIPMFDFSLGFGSDIISTLHYYSIGDPLNFLAIFFKPEDTEYLFGILAILRMYLAGLAFSYFIRTKTDNSRAVILSSLIYSYSAFALKAACQHPFFTTVLIYFPLIVLGIDKILEGKNPALYIVSIALITISNYYFAYIACIFMVIYAAIKYISEYRKDGTKKFFATVGKFALFTVNGFLIAMIIFLPVALTTFLSGRFESKSTFDLFNNLYYYTDLLPLILDSSKSSQSLVIGYNGITLLCVFVSFIKFKKHKSVNILYLICIVFAVFPVFGHIFNGFSYVTQRWCWIFAFLGSAAVATVFDELFELSQKEKKALLAVMGIYAAANVIVPRAKDQQAFLMLFIAAFAIAAVLSAGAGILAKATAKRTLSVLIMASILVQSSSFLSVNENNYISSFMSLGDYYEYAVEKTPAAAIKNLSDDEDFYRYDAYGSNLFNDAMSNDVNSTSFCLSLANSSTGEFLNEIGLNVLFEHQYYNVDNRLILQYLTGCKYMYGSIFYNKDDFYMITPNYKSFLNAPYFDYDENKIQYSHGILDYTASERSSSAFVSVTENYMPMGYTYDTVMSREEYEKLTAAEKQNILLQTAVTDIKTNLPHSEIRQDDLKEIPLSSLKIKAENSDDIIVKDNCIIVNDCDSTIDVTVPIVYDAEMYVSWEGCKYEDICTNIKRDKTIEEYYEQEEERVAELSPEDTAEASYPSDNYVKELDKLTLTQYERSKAYYSPASKVSVGFSVSDSQVSSAKSYFSYVTPSGQFYSGHDNYMVNLGYFSSKTPVENDATTITIDFSHDGIYYFDNLNVVFQSLKNVNDDAEKRKQDVLTDVTVTDNKVQGKISLDEPKLLATQIPYSDGWKVYVDGNEAELASVNTMFCGVMLQEGDHEITFKYLTPHIKIAAGMSIFGLIMLGVTAVAFGKLKAKKEKTSDGSENGEDVK